MNNQNSNNYTFLQLFRDAKSLFNYLWRKRLIILLFSLVCTAIGILYAWQQQAKYTATLTFVTDNQQTPGLGVLAGLASQFGVDAGGGGSAFEGENLIELLKSRLLVEKTLLSPVTKDGKQLMIDLHLQSNEINKDWSKDEKLKNVIFSSEEKPTRIEDSILYVVYKDVINANLTISKRDKRLALVEISFTHPNELFSKRFTEILTENAIAFYTDYKVKRSKQNVDLLQRQTDSVRRMLYGGISEAAVATDLNINPIKQVIRAGVQRRQADVQVSSAVYGELVKNLELARLALRKETPLIQIIDLPKFPLEKKKLGRFKGGLIFGLVGVVGVVTFFTVLFWLKTLKSVLPRAETTNISATI